MHDLTDRPQQYLLKHRSMTPAQYVAAPLAEGVTAAITCHRARAKVYPSKLAALAGKHDDLGEFAELFEIVPALTIVPT